MNEIVVDINADLGESEERLADGSDFELMRYITSANIACGGHAGDERTMRETLMAVKELGVAAGAHPGYPDRANFGRNELTMPAAEVESFAREQIVALTAIARSLGMELVHVKPHGALYHVANKNQGFAAALGRAVLAIDPRLTMVGQAGSTTLETWRSMGLRVAAEAFADRAYEPNGLLRKRTLPGALLDDPSRASEQALNIATRHQVRATDGSELSISAETLCIHSDTPGSAIIAREVHRRLLSEGIKMQALR